MIRKILIVFVLVVIPMVSFADQFDSSSQGDNFLNENGTERVQPLGLGSSFTAGTTTVTGFYIYVRSNDDTYVFNGFGDWGMQFFCYDTPTSTGCTDPEISDSSINGFINGSSTLDYSVPETKTLLFYQLEEPMTILPNRYYTIEETLWQGGVGPSDVTIYGADDLDDSLNWQAFDFGEETVITDIYWQLTFGAGGSGETVSRIIRSNGPLNGALTVSTEVLFDFDYYYNDIADPNISIAGAEISNLTAGITLVPLEDTIITSGESNFSQIVSLSEANLYLWRPYLRTSTSTEFIYGDWYSFDVVSASASSSQYIDPFTGLPLVSTSTYFGDLLNFPSRLTQKAPFSYFYEIKGIFDSFSGEDETGAFPSITLDLSSSSIPFSIEIFSQSTIDNSFLPSGFISTLRTLMVASMWLSFSIMVFFTIKRLV